MTREPRPAFVSVGELFGGVERHLLGMCTWMRRRGREPLLVLFHDRELARQARTLGVEPIVLETSGGFDLRAPRRLAEVLVRNGVDVVHAHGYRAMVTVALARPRCKVAVVRTVHGLPEGAGLFAAEMWKGRLYTWLENAAARMTGAVSCYVTRDLMRRAGRDKGAGGAGVVYNGIDPLDRDDYQRPADLDPGVYHFAAVGRVSAVKGLHHALAAMGRLDPSLPVTLDIIGTGPLEGDLKSAIASRGLCARVRMLGFKENIYDYLAHIDCLLMPSLHEGLPYTVLEAMSLGIPIVASRAGGLVEVLDHERNALLVEVGDVAGLAKAMESLVRDPARGKALGADGRSKQNLELNLELMGMAYWGVYETILN